MKKLYLLTCLLLASLAAQATFVPNSGLLYNIIQTNSEFTLGMIGTQPVVQAVNSRTSQAFQFVPVVGKTDTYWIINLDGYYLNKKTSVSWDYWDVNFETVVNGTNSEWTIVGEASGFRLMCGANSLYLASDQITNGSPLYCDKSADHANGLFKVAEAFVIREVFEIADYDLGIQVEKDVQPYPVTITSSGIYENIYAKASTGFSINKSTFTPEEFLANGGKLQMEVSTSAAPGTKGHIYFAVGTGSDATEFDSLSVMSVAKQKRYYIRNTSSDGLVIGNHSVENVPALTDNLGASSQKFMLRPVHPTLNDSLFYLVQDGTYRMIIKAFSSPWDVEYSSSCSEAVWKIVPQGNGKIAIYNHVTKNALGTDDITVDSRLYDDKIFTASPTGKPYCEWKLIDTDSLSVFGVFKMAEKNQVIAIEKDFQSYPVNITTSGVKETITALATNGFSIDKTTFTTTDVALASGKFKVRISSSAAVGTTGEIYFSRASSAIPFDTLHLISVAVLPRYYVMNVSSNGFVIGNDSTNTVPALTETKGESTQKFIIRPVHPTLNDSLYYFIQDGDYRLLAKDKTSAWSTTFSILPTEEAIWKIIPKENNIIAIENFVTKMVLGSDAVTINSWLWDDKTFVSSPNSAPYCEWKLVNLDGSAFKNVQEGMLEVIAKDGIVQVKGFKNGERMSVYDLFGRLVQTHTTEASSLTLNLKSGLYLIQIGNKTVKVIL